MKLTAYSRNRLLQTMSYWRVPGDFKDPMYNYLVHGFSPGNCFTSVLANDFAGAIQSSHPANTIEAFKSVSSWIRDHIPAQAKGSYQAVRDWCSLGAAERRLVLEQHQLIYTDKEEVWAVLQGKPTNEPVFY